MAKQSKVRRNVSMEPRVDDLLDEFAEEWGTTRSDIVNKAVLEYVDKDRVARIEEKLDRLLEGEGGDLRENPDEKEKDDTQSSASPKQSRTDEFYSQLRENVLDKDADVVERAHIETAIEHCWGDASEYMVEKYVPKVGDRLREDGWTHIEGADYWCKTDEAHDRMLSIVWRRSSGEANSPDGLESVRESERRLESNESAFIEQGIAEQSEVRSAIGKLQGHESRLSRRKGD